MVEVLMATSVGLLLLGITLDETISKQRLLNLDVARTRMNQNLRSAMDIIGMNVRESGENLATGFPAIEIIDGASGAPDQLILRRNMLDEVLNVCTAIAAGSGTTTIEFANASGNAGCDYASNMQNYSSWRSYRLSEPGQRTFVYVIDSATRLGEFVTYTGETDDGSANYSISTAGHTWVNDYPVATSAAYVIEEWKFQVVNGNLQLIIGEDTANAMNVVYGINDFQVVATLTDGTVKNAFARTDDWTQIKKLTVTLNGQDSFAGQTLTNSLEDSYFPRNILSN